MLNPLSQYLAIGKLLALLGAVALICWQSSQIHSAREHGRALQAQLDAITSKRNEQKVITRERIVTVEKQVRHADEVAKTIEQAPLPGQCRTPKEVLDAEI